MGFERALRAGVSCMVLTPLREQDRTCASRAEGGGRRLASTPLGLFLASAVLLALPAILSACGGGARQDENEPKGTWKVDIISASFPGRQYLAQTSQLRITVRNLERRAIPSG